ncbi:MAG: prolyl oligopeptidase family serine peptidase, partial [Acidobacteriota bacterium]|nr:prolyl oligopeptidase family serine peptidase [Acidobacteriota bacterium]
AYISRRRTHSFLALFELKTQTLSFPAPSTGNDSAPSFSRDGKYLAWLRFPFTSAGEFAGNRTSANPWSIQLDDLATGTTRTLFTPGVNQPGSAEPRMSTGEPRLFFAAGNKVLFFSEADGWVHLYSIDSAISAPPILLTSGKSEVEDATISADGKSLLYATSAPDGYAYAGPSGGFREPNFLELPGADRRHILQIRFEHLSEKTKSISFGDGIETHPMLAGDGTAIAALVSDARTPMHPALIDHDRSAPKPLHPAALPKDYPAAALVTPQQVLFPSSDKLFQLHGQLFLPKQEADSSAALRNDKGTLRNDKGVALRNGNDKGVVRKHPAILFFHGGPKRQMLLGYPAMGYYSNAYAMNQYLASRGYIVLSVNYRGGIGYGLDFRQCQHCGADGAAEYADALGAAAYLRSRPDVDTAHIGIWGGSYGGYFVALALARNSDIFAAGVDFHGVHEWAREDNAAADWLRGSLADQERIAALAHASSPMADVAKWRSPVLLIHGDDDPDVAYTQTTMLADALRARGVHVEELIFPDELHGFLLHKDWLAAYQAASDFFDRTLKPTGSKRKIPD